jgi:hypothetical protein
METHRLSSLTTASGLDFRVMSETALLPRPQSLVEASVGAAAFKLRFPRLCDLNTNGSNKNGSRSQGRANYLFEGYFFWSV